DCCKRHKYKCTSNLYYAMLGLISGDRELFTHNAKLLLLYAVGIAVGLWIISELEYIRTGIKNKVFSSK
ncbi:MAG: hypothetical protein MJ150_05115, partial [Clostridia bacterium]|nr:hypothetical protein [Clostridia bacterium]